MKNLFYALIALFGVLVAVVTASVLLSSSLREIEGRIECYSLGEDISYAEVEQEFKLIYDEFSTRTSMLSLLVADDALREIEHSFNEVICSARAESEDGVLIAIGRLRIDLAELRELAGLTLKSVF